MAREKTAIANHYTHRHLPAHRFSFVPCVVDSVDDRYATA